MPKSTFERTNQPPLRPPTAEQTGAEVPRVTEPHLPYAYHAGRIVPLEHATVNIMTHGFQYGVGCFAGIRAYYNDREDQCYVFRLRDHLERLVNSCRILQLRIEESVGELMRILLALAAQNDYHGDTYFRPFVYSREHTLSPRTHNVATGFSLYSIPLADYVDTSSGLKTMVSSWRRIDDDMIPTRAKASGGYVNSALAKSEALQNGCDEAIFLNRDGRVCEGSAENLFIVRDGVLITPTLSANLLEGVTRKTLIHLARRELGVAVHERPIARTELYIADEAFFSGTGAQVAWIREIDKRPVGDGTIGPITGRLKELYLRVAKGMHPAYRHWITPVFERGYGDGHGDGHGRRFDEGSGVDRV